MPQNRCLCDCPMPERNFKNHTLYHGDNLAFLRGINSGTIDLIATDPPFNKNKDFHATPDSLSAGAKFQDRWSWHRDIHDDWLIAIQRDDPEVWRVISTAKAVYGDDMGAFLCWLGVRLLEMHRILAEHGSLYLHVDDTAQAWVKCLLDAIFGRDNFRNAVIWKRTRRGFKGSQWKAKRYNSNTDTILFYAKSAKSFFDQTRVATPYEEGYLQRAFKLKDYKSRYYLDLAYNRPSASPRPNLCYEYRGFTPPHSSGWKVGLARMKELDAEGELVIADGELWRKIRPKLGRIRNTLWDDINETLGNEDTGYPTQKPLPLYERIILASSNPDDMVLDPFCGCATTPIAAERLGRQWIGMDIWDGAYQHVKQRIQVNRQLLLDSDPQIFYSTTPPQRTDSGETAALILEMQIAYQTRRHPPPRTQHGKLLADIGPLCQGCGADYNFDPRVLEVDHINPRSQGGTDAYENLTLLCPPCNKEKRDRYTLIGLQQFNKSKGHMKSESNLRMGRASGRTSRRRRR